MLKFKKPTCILIVSEVLIQWSKLVISDNEINFDLIRTLLIKSYSCLMRK